ncbi:hypothetical protein [Phenylobacterium sp.]|uniref:hypothetical protein n=1 Tax=Phenylobacterium sp. TaxID=1871053 RepID=UPI002CC51D34|nr:hypothetical protein [Phenylobacterium sp.]HLZ74913.1 hypothetical protein [Phenylobacterium sp.]
MTALSQREAPPAPADPSPSDRFLAHRKTILLRDWILALIALGLILAASAFHSELGDPPPDEPHAVAPQHV